MTCSDFVNQKAKNVSADKKMVEQYFVSVYLKIDQKDFIAF